jgi:hypothetical protein
MNIQIDYQLVDKIELDPIFQSMLSKINYEGDRYFRQAWVMHQANKESLVIKKWYPILIKDNETGVIGFEFNPGGWKSKKKLGNPN